MITRVAKNRTTDRRKKKYTFSTYNIDDIYKDFVLVQSQMSEDLRIDLSIQDFKAIVHEANKEFSEMIGTEGSSFKLPYNTGQLAIIKDKVKFQDNEIKAMFDYGHYHKTGEKRHHILKDKDYRARWWWSKRKCKVKNKNMYSFTPTRTNTQKVARVMLKAFGYNTYLTKSKI
jgi:hypothetical protein